MFMKNKSLGLLASLAIVCHAAPQLDSSFFFQKASLSFIPSVTAASSDTLAQAYAKQLSNVQVWGRGVVVKILKDDNDGSRHQRFVLRVPSGQTVLIAHNIDLAPRVEPLREGDTVEFFGEYEWNSKGGVVHWTHRDPVGRHEAGWLKLGGRTYQ